MRRADKIAENGSDWAVVRKVGWIMLRCISIITTIRDAIISRWKKSDAKEDKVITETSWLASLTMMSFERPSSGETELGYIMRFVLFYS